MQAQSYTPPPEFDRDWSAYTGDDGDVSDLGLDTPVVLESGGRVSLDKRELTDRQLDAYLETVGSMPVNVKAEIRKSLGDPSAPVDEGDYLHAIDERRQQIEADHPELVGTPISRAVTYLRRWVEENFSTDIQTVRREFSDRLDALITDAESFMRGPGEQQQSDENVQLV